MTPEIPPTTAIDSDAGRSPCCDADLVLSSPPHGYECRDCTRPYDLIGDSVEDVSEETGRETDSGGEAEEYPDREDEYVQDGLCGFYDADSMDSPCSRDAGWGRDVTNGKCKDHA